MKKAPSLYLLIMFAIILGSLFMTVESAQSYDLRGNVWYLVSGQTPPSGYTLFIRTRKEGSNRTYWKKQPGSGSWYGVDVSGEGYYDIHARHKKDGEWKTDGCKYDVYFDGINTTYTDFRVYDWSPPEP